MHLKKLDPTQVISRGIYNRNQSLEQYAYSEEWRTELATSELCSNIDTLEFSIDKEEHTQEPPQLDSRRSVHQGAGSRYVHNERETMLIEITPNLNFRTHRATLTFPASLSNENKRM